MSVLITIVVVLILVGLALWAIDSIPMDATIKRIIHVLVIIGAILYVLSALGVLPNLR